MEGVTSRLLPSELSIVSSCVVLLQQIEVTGVESLCRDHGHYPKYSVEYPSTAAVPFCF